LPGGVIGNTQDFDSCISGSSPGWAVYINRNVVYEKIVMKDLRTIILAAGKGTRMKSATPKVLHKVCGKPIIQYVLDVANAVGSQKIFTVVGHKSDKLESFLGDVVTVEQKKLLGTADAVKSAQNHFRSFNGSVLVMCGDTPLLKKETIRTLIRKHKKSKSVCTFLTTVVHNPEGYGRIIRDEVGKVVAIREDKDASGFELNIAEINVGVYCFNSKELFSGLKEIDLNPKKKEYYLTDLIELFKDKGLSVETVETEDCSEGLGVNTREDLAAASEKLRFRVLKNLMADGVTIVDPKTTYIDANVKIGKDTVINPFTVIESDVRIGELCTIGPFARLRSQTSIGNKVEVGNFTEISRSKVGNKSVMKHFSYLGDASVGSDVNIGAGVVTANFDGKNKNLSKISDGAFIGSNAVLIAPAKVGKNAVVGAGSVVVKSKTIPDNGVAVGVPAKITSKGKQKK
jgi:bifunctional UDP-N-acetylglucosamine pyrophosphorylase/glucosamine-1-phosphate N-acetyltransferase